MNFVVQLSYLLAAVLFILGLKAMSSPRTARKGIMWAGAGMVLATLVTFLHPAVHGLTNYVLIVIAIAAAGGLAWWSGRRVGMTEMPQMVALYNGMGGGAAAAIAAVEMLRALRTLPNDLQVRAEALAADADISVQAATAALRAEGAGSVGIAGALGADVAILAILGAFIGTVAFSGSLIAWAKLDGRMKRSQLVPGQQIVNIVVFALAVLFGILTFFTDSALVVAVFFALGLLFGVFVAVPIGGADMPVIISLFNALTGLAVGFEGYAIGNPAMIIAGTVVGAAGTLLTQLMAKAMNRPLTNVLFAGWGSSEGASSEGPAGEMKDISAEDAGIMMAYAERVIIVPGYGMAVAQAQHKIWEFVELLQDRGVEVKFAIHPVAGRMPGHMNVLLAEAGVPYDMIFDMEDINEEFAMTDVAVVIGANDVVNPAARDDPSSPIYGMPILNVDEAENVMVIKRGGGAGFSGVENHLFYGENTRMVFGDGQKVAGGMVQAVKGL
ncbi:MULTISPECIES: NAD(P)(+) transhydrogenase (Re/Si-specific) subunit beta [Spiribacter]|jgi:NAD(P) transhydrogenase subunit beta|uniref:NAD(P)(+) transhydrogenase (Re/Si-specific) subunit beta n=1 Tax=Spiribacter TaxID=1335745 RepID=UPI000D8F850C|nr:MULTISPECIES: NAD(P)(+) transhydrogenase (Re/Si-specific) subunit beta [Spiribacter]PZA00986.1 NAD(P)(+) transhydrogenase (Re/Si-specific) subunit beta [Gammaproteobacteria bacterium 2W06]AUB77724.1 NAD(P) transhydrogenase subunit beta [Spiribacter roseus]KAF0281555.1 NAD(P) transhydrogenase subunit beta [Spiribacter roseus]KAF0283054.1 NAD(P) transhydrogenase subunit beta [Spiribacter roseus]KAF0285086.1 NAD(P) transhydrogenase subunit beta [Spiribacter sp. SSL99]